MPNEVIEIPSAEMPVNPPDPPRTALFTVPDAENFRNSWRDIQGSFVDEPRHAVEKADQLVESMIRRVTDSLAAERAKLENAWGRGAEISTEELRQSLRCYRAFFDRLLAS